MAYDFANNGPNGIGDAGSGVGDSTPRAVNGVLGVRAVEVPTVVETLYRLDINPPHKNVMDINTTRI